MVHLLAFQLLEDLAANEEIVQMAWGHGQAISNSIHMKLIVGLGNP